MGGGQRVCREPNTSRITRRELLCVLHRSSRWRIQKLFVGSPTSRAPSFSNFLRADQFWIKIILTTEGSEPVNTFHTHAHVFPHKKAFYGLSVSLHTPSGINPKIRHINVHNINMQLASLFRLYTRDDDVILLFLLHHLPCLLYLRSALPPARLRQHLPSRHHLPSLRQLPYRPEYHQRLHHLE